MGMSDNTKNKREALNTIWTKILDKGDVGQRGWWWFKSKIFKFRPKLPPPIYAHFHSLWKKHATTILIFLPVFSDPFAIFILLCMKAPMLPRPPSRFLRTIMTSFCSTHPRTHCAISQVVTTHLHEAVVSAAGEITYLPTITPSARPDVSS
jgi:hypothetical protein